MKAIVVLFDSLNRNYLPNYGDTTTIAPNFERLASRSVTFDRCYAGSLPCMPARREFHTGRYNFLHRNWGPLEPFDDSMPQQLSDAGIYTHLVTDHAHYWEDGGSTYHTRYNSWEAVRGQQGDMWKGQVAEPEIPAPYRVPLKPDGKTVASVWRNDWVNRQYLKDDSDYPQNRTFSLALDFIEKNRTADNWMLHVETFDPHEPFIVPNRFKQMYPGVIDDLNFDWPRGVADDDKEIVGHVRALYRARVSMCDENLGRVLDMMDRENLWDDTMLIVMSDHGFLLGEHQFWGKNGVSMYEEIAHTPLFVWDPRHRKTGERRSSLVQTIDFGPTILDYFGQPVPEHAQGRPLAETVASDVPVREFGLFGFFGESVNITDGRRVYMRYPASPDNTPLYMYTLEPHNMYALFPPNLLHEAEFVRPEWPFLKGCPVLRVPGAARNRIAGGKEALFDLETDPGQLVPLDDPAESARLESAMLEAMQDSDAPPEQYERLGMKLD